MAAHWSRDMYTIWWRDAGTGRMRVSFHRDRDRLLARLANVYHPDMDAALYSPDGTRLPLSAGALGEPAPKRKRKARATKSAEIETEAA